jgi:hypothetical protein
VLVTDKLASYGVARRRLMTGVAHRRSKYLNNRAENAHQPTRQRERAMKRFTSARHAQRFLSAFSGISPHFRPRRHLLHAEEYRREMANRFSRGAGKSRVTSRKRERVSTAVPISRRTGVSVELTAWAEGCDTPSVWTRRTDRRGR